MSKLSNAGFVAAGFIGGGVVSLFIVRFGQTCTVATGMGVVVWGVFMAILICTQK